MSAAEHPAVREFLDRFSAMMEGEGLPRPAGRMLGLLFVLGDPQTAEELSRKLGISRSNVSTTVRLLASFGLVERRRPAGERQDLFRLPAEPFLPMLQAGVARASRMRDLVAECRAGLPVALGGAARRMGELERFFGFSAEWLASMAAEWKAAPPDAGS